MRPPIEEEIEAAEVEVAEDQQQTAVMLVSTRLAGNAVIRVVNRCNEAQESNNLGTYVMRRRVNADCVKNNTVVANSKKKTPNLYERPGRRPTRPDVDRRDGFRVRHGAHIRFRPNNTARFLRRKRAKFSSRLRQWTCLGHVFGNRL